jgi:hypothetical protein
MTGWFARLPIRRKLIALILAASAAVAIIAGTVHMVTSYLTTRAQVAEDSEDQAQVLVDNAHVAVQFLDTATAHEMLESLESTDGFRAACLYGRDNALFAQLVLPDAAPCAPVAPPVGTGFKGARLEVTRFKEKDGVRATVYVRTDVTAVQARIRRQGFIIAGVMLIAFGVATLLSARLQAFVSEPVAELSHRGGDLARGGLFHPGRAPHRG